MGFDRVGIGATDGWLTATGHCVEAGESGLPYAPLSGILAAIGASPLGAELLHDVASRSPGLLPLVPNGTIGVSSVDSTSGLSQLRLLDALVRMFNELSTHHPTLLIIEDLHWSDPSTRAFVSFLCRNLTPQRLGLVLTTRTDELHRKHPLRPLLGELTRLPVVKRIDLEPLSVDELGDLMAGLQGARPPRVAVRRIADRSGGNPFFAEQLLAVGADRSHVRRTG